MTGPVFRHYCEACQYLGRTWAVQKTADLYVCAEFRPLHSTVLARFSDEGDDYASSPADLLSPEPIRDMEGKLGYSSSGPALMTAKLFAQVKGLLT